MSTDAVEAVIRMHGGVKFYRGVPKTYEAWVAGMVVETGQPKGRLRKDANGLRFVEVTINGPKTWSFAAALHPEV